MSVVAGQTELLGRYPYDGDPIWPVSLEELKQHIQIGHDEDDALLQFETGGWLASATEEIETRGQVALIEQRRRLLLDHLPSDEAIFIPRGKMSELTVIKYLDADDVEQTLAASNYRVVTRGKCDAIFFKDTAASIAVADGPGVVWVDYVAGYGRDQKDVPAQWRSLVAAVACHLYERREMVAGGGIDKAFEAVIDRKCILAGARRRYV